MNHGTFSKKDDFAFVYYGFTPKCDCHTRTMKHVHERTILHAILIMFLQINHLPHKYHGKNFIGSDFTPNTTVKQWLPSKNHASMMLKM